MSKRSAQAIPSYSGPTLFATAARRGRATRGRLETLAMHVGGTNNSSMHQEHRSFILRVEFKGNKNKRRHTTSEHGRARAFRCVPRALHSPVVVDTALHGGVGLDAPGEVAGRAEQSFVQV